MESQNLMQTTVDRVQSKGGGGVMVVPAGVVEITQDRTTFVPIGVNRQMLAALPAGAVAGFLVGRPAENALGPETKTVRGAAESLCASASTVRNC